MQLSLHTPHVTGQCSAMKPGLSLHPPASAQPEHCFLLSLHSGVHTPHEIGHSLYIISGFSSHWPSCAHETHDSCVSEQLKLHTPHESGQSVLIESGLASHSPSRAHPPQSVLLSLHTPAAARPRLKTSMHSKVTLSVTLRVTPFYWCNGLHPRFRQKEGVTRCFKGVTPSKRGCYTLKKRV